MSFLYDAVHEAINESLEPIYTSNNKTVIKSEDFEGTCYMVFNNYVDEDNPGKFEETFFNKNEAINYVNNSSDIVKGPNNTDWHKNEEGEWLPLTYADGYKSLPELPKEVSDYMDVWFGFDIMVGMNPDGKIIMDNAGEYTKFDSVEDFIKEIKYDIEENSKLSESLEDDEDIKSEIRNLEKIYNGAKFRGADVPEPEFGYINQANIPDNMRLKYLEINVKDDVIYIDYITQEPFNENDFEEFLAEVTQALYVRFDELSTEPIKFVIEAICRDGKKYGHKVQELVI